MSESLAPPSGSPRPDKVHLPLVPTKSSIRGDGSRVYVHPADVSGRFATWRRVAFVVLLAVYGALPWIHIGGAPAVYLDIERRSFHLFGASFNAQDIWMTVFVLTGAAFGLVSLTAVAGRVWCGWACPQTVFLEGLFRRVERLVEGPRDKRLRRNAGPLTWDKAWRKTVSWSLYTALAFVVAHVFLAYFVSVPQLLSAMRHAPSAHPEAFAVVMSLTALLLFNFGWFREQFCVILCPYGRLQSTLLDKDSLVIGYDRARGEPRGKAKRAASSPDGHEAPATNAPPEKTGDCVDCGRCVVVCPTGIDIREGLQMDCIACSACIDACDEIMDKLKRPRGLVRYDSTRGLDGGGHRFWRPRIALYAVLGAVGLAVATFAFGRRVDYEANVLRVQGAPFTVEGDRVQNAFTVHLVNKRSQATTFVLEPVTAEATFVIPLARVELRPLAQVTAPVFVSLPLGAVDGARTVSLRVTPSGAEKDARVVALPFLGPKR